MDRLADVPSAAHPISTEPLVFIVNGDPTMRALLEDIVNAAELRTVTFGSAGEYFNNPRISLASCAILDVALPDSSGLELQERLTSEGTPVVFVTRSTCIASCVRALKSGAVDFLSMPCNPEEVLNAVRSALHRALQVRREHEMLHALSCRWEQLTQREREVFALVASGLLNKQTARQLCISEITVQIHRGRVMKKMGACSFAALVRMADALRIARDCPQLSPANISDARKQKQR